MNEEILLFSYLMVKNADQFALSTFKSGSRILIMSLKYRLVIDHELVEDWYLSSMMKDSYCNYIPLVWFASCECGEI